MIRVLQVLMGLSRGGLETFIVNVYRSIDKQKVSGDVLDIEVNDRFSQNTGEVKKALLTRDHDDTIMSVIKDGYETFYKVPKIIKYSFDIDNRLPSTLSEGVRAFRNFRQYAITGKVADPTFSFRSMLYTTQENIGALKTIAVEMLKSSNKNIQLVLMKLF